MNLFSLEMLPFFLGEVKPFSASASMGRPVTGGEPPRWLVHPARPTHLPPGQFSNPAGGGHSATRFPDEEVETLLILIFFRTVHPSIHLSSVLLSTHPFIYRYPVRIFVSYP